MTLTLEENVVNKKGKAATAEVEVGGNLKVASTTWNSCKHTSALQQWAVKHAHTFTQGTIAMGI